MTHPAQGGGGGETLHLFSVFLANDTKESMFGHRNISSPAAGIEPMTSSTKGTECADHKATTLPNDIQVLRD